MLKGMNEKIEINKEDLYEELLRSDKICKSSRRAVGILKEGRTILFLLIIEFSYFTSCLITAMAIKNYICSAVFVYHSECNSSSNSKT